MTDLLPPTSDGLAIAADLLRSGDVVAFPTDTVYGLGVAAAQPQRIGALFELKHRPLDRRIPILVADLAQAAADGWLADERAHRLADRFWPGALTLVLRAPDGGATQAFRAPDHQVALELIRLAGPILATSANHSDEPETLGADEVLIAFATQQDELAAIVDGGPVPGGVASTVLDLSVTPARIMREGPVTRQQLAEIVELAP
jgi:L-threonylcarbamoyladenylate synthase